MLSSFAATTVPANLYRMSGKPQYAASTAQPQLFSQPEHGRPSPLPDQPTTGIPFPPQSGFFPGPPPPPPQQQSSQRPIPGFMPRPFDPSSGFSSPAAFAAPPAGDHSHVLEPDNAVHSYQIHPPVGLPAAGQVYLPVQPHWYHRVKIEGRDIWRPFSNLDSRQLEEALKRGKQVLISMGPCFLALEICMKHRL